MPKHKCQFSLCGTNLIFTKEELEGKEYIYQCDKCSRVLVVKSEVVEDMDFVEYCCWACNKTKEGD